MADLIEKLRIEITYHQSNARMLELGYKPLFAASEKARIVVVGQAPGVRAQNSGLAWDDASGLRLMTWMGIMEEAFRDENLIAHLPMDF